MSKSVPASKVSANDSVAKGRLAQIRIYENAEYRYYQVKDLALSANRVVEYSTTTDAVTMDRAGGTSIGRTVAGVAVATVSAGNYGWVQVSGSVSALTPAAIAIAAGDLVVPHATSDGGINKATTATFRHAFAVALGADTATTTGAGVTKIALIRV